MTSHDDHNPVHSSGDGKDIGAARSLAKSNVPLTGTDLGLDRIEPRKLAVMAARTNSGVVITDRQGRIQWVNRGFERITGYSLDELIGLKPGQVLHGPLTDQSVVDRMRQALSEQRGFEVEIINYTKQGWSFWNQIEVQPLLDDQGRIEGYMGLETDVTERRRQQETLQENELLFRQAMDYAPIGIALVSPKGHWLRVNQAFSQMLGYSAQEMLELTFQQITHPDDLSRNIEMFHRVLAGAFHQYELEKRYRHKMGHWVWVHVNSSLIRDPDGRPKHLITHVQDVTQRRAAQEALRQSEHRYRSIVNHAADAILTLNDAGQVISANPAARQLFGYGQGELVGVSAADLFSHPSLPATADQVRELLAGDRNHQAKLCELTGFRRDGGRMPIQVSVSESGHASSRMLTAIVRDLTANRQAQAALSESEAAKGAILRSALDAIITMDHLGRVLEFNPAAETILGYKREQALGRPLAELIVPMILRGHHEDDPQSLNPKALGQLTGRRAEIRLVRADGSLFPCEISVCIVQPQGKLPQYTAFLRDLTERKEAEANVEHYLGDLWEANLKLETQTKELKDATHAAEVANLAKSQFLANMSHEIRTPMTAIMGYTDLLRNPELAPADRFNYIQTIRRNGQHLLTILNDILDLSKIEAGKMVVEKIATDPWQIVDEAIELMRPRAEEKGLTLTARQQGSIPENIESDPTRLRQILMNLLGNAIKFTQTGSVLVTMRLEKQADGEHPPVDRLLFAVKDSGIGMTVQQMEQLFRPFTQADTSTTRKFGGTGLGLTISKRLATKLGGDLTVQSHENEGSVFTLSVDPGAMGPLLAQRPERKVAVQISASAAAAAATIAGADHAPGTMSPKASPVVTAVRAAASAGEKTVPANGQGPSDLKGVRLLVAEDSPDIQMLVQLTLMSLGAQVTLVDNGQKARDAALAAAEKGEMFDAVLMDMQMPVMDGYEASKQLRAKGYVGAIIALTAHGMSGDRQRCMDAGCDDYAIKPIDQTALMQTIQKHQGKGKRSPQAA